MEAAPTAFAGVDEPAVSVRAGLYERVSRFATAADRERARSIEQQNAENRADCAREAWAVTEVYQDPGLSASRFASAKGGANRGDYRRMEADVRAGRLDVLVLWEPSRGNRELEGWAGLLNACRATGTGIYVTSHKRLYDLSQARDWRSLAEDGLDSAYESEKISVRIRRGKEASRAAGRPQGAPVYGTRRVFDPRTRAWLRDEADQGTIGVVAEIKARAAAGESYTGIRDDLNARGIPSPGGTKWSARTVARVAASPVYGQMGLIDADTDARALFRVSDKARKGERPSRQAFRYSGILHCAQCGEGTRAQTRSASVRYYNCRHGHAYVDVAAADAFIDSMAIERLSLPDLASMIDQADAAAAAEAEAADAEARRGRRKIEEATDSYNADRIGIESLEKVEKLWRPKIAAAEARAAELRMPSALVGLPDPDPVKVARKWKALSTPARKAAVRALMPKLELRNPPQPRIGAAEAVDQRIIPWPEDH
jgi:DNA invertase Pin-like site-specific DNA recombinase